MSVDRTPAATTVATSDHTLATGTLRLISLRGHEGRPPTLDEGSLAALRTAIREAEALAGSGELTAVALAGQPGAFAAGADLKAMATIATADDARRLATVGHDLVTAIVDLPVPTFAYLTGLALGGGLELALACDYRVAAADVRALGLPETALGLVPGWGGCYLLPRLLGAEQALRVIVDNPARNRTLTAQQALDVGLVDTIARARGEQEFLDDAMAWTTEVVAGATGPHREDHTRDAAVWQEAVTAREPAARQREAGGAPAARRALELVRAARTSTRSEAFAAEDAALVDLVMSDQLRAGLYGFTLTNRRTRPAPDAPAPRPVRRVGILGAGLMAGQLAMVLARNLEVPVVMREIDAQRAEAGHRRLTDEISRLESRGRLDAETAAALRSRIEVTDDVATLAGADLVVEAVFEELGVKQAALVELEEHVSSECVIATNTSALSVSAMGEVLRHPERLVGLHFFNPVAQMPLVEIVRTPATDDTTDATAVEIVRGVRKTAITCRDAPGFVVNRLLVRLLGEVLGSLEDGTSLADADAALAPMGLPMGPFQLLQLVGPAVARHVLDSLREGLGERYPTSPGLDRMVAQEVAFVDFEGRPTATSPVRADIADYFASRPLTEPLDAAGVLRRVQDALAQEARLMLDEGVVARVSDVDLGMILGAGWPLHNGGLTPYLDRTGASERAAGGRFHAPGVASLP